VRPGQVEPVSPREGSIGGLIGAPPYPGAG